MLSFLVDAKKKKSQKQAIKSLCLMLRNRSIEKQPALTRSIQLQIQKTFTAALE